MPALFFLVCPDCHQNIWLPASKHPETTCDQSPWPTDLRSRNFSCPGCRFATSYSPGELQCDPEPDQAVLQLLQGAKLVCTETLCGLGNCQAPVRILSVTTEPLAANTPDPSIFLNATAANLRCLAGHVLSGRSKLSGNLKPCADPEWDQS